MGGKKIKQNLTGQRFGRLVVEKYLTLEERNDGKHKIWRCRCDCGGVVNTTSRRLLTGHTRSCGCLQRENAAIIARETRSKTNLYEFKDDYVIGYTSKGEEFWFDIEDYEIVKQFCWNKTPEGYFESGKLQDGKKTRYRLHRLVMGVTDDYVVDHICGKETRYDNRKCNLRIASRQQNAMNIGLRADNTSGVTGVNWHKVSNKWRARIEVNYQAVHLGLFEKFEDAVAARKAAEEKYFGEWSYDNSQKLGIKLKEGAKNDGQENRDDVSA